jgi:hypothetical protein
MFGFGFLEAMLVCLVPFLIGVGLIYMGTRRANKQMARFKTPTRWDYLNQAGGYFIVGGVFLAFGMLLLLGTLFVFIF